MTEEELLTFAREAVGSVWNLELLLLLRRDPDRAWAVPDLVTALHANTRIVTEGLATLNDAGLVTAREDDAHQFLPASPVIADLTTQLANLHALKPVAVVNAILTAPNDKIRTFADAFRFRGRT